MEAAEGTQRGHSLNCCICLLAARLLINACQLLEEKIHSLFWFHLLFFFLPGVTHVDTEGVGPADMD